MTLKHRLKEKNEFVPLRDLLRCTVTLDNLYAKRYGKEEREVIIVILPFT